jgi:hypothetical protein
MASFFPGLKSSKIMGPCRLASNDAVLLFREVDNWFIRSAANPLPKTSN